MEIISIIGATGALGGGLARCWARAGHQVIVGSRDAARAEQAAAAINEEVSGNLVKGMNNVDAAAAGEIVVVAVKFDHQQDTLMQIREAVQGKVVIDTTVPLIPPRVARVQLPPEGCAAVIAQQILGDDVRVVSAFQNVAADALTTGADIECDVLVAGDNVDDRQKVIDLADAAGMQAWHAGPLANSAAAEALTSVLIHMNKRYDSEFTGIKISGLADQKT